MIGLSAKTQVLAGEYFDRVVKRERTLSVYKVIDFDYCNTGEYREYYVHKKNYESGEVGKMFLPIDDDYLSVLVDLDGYILDVVGVIHLHDY